MRHAIGLDLGGSSAKLALVSEQGKALCQETVLTPASSDPLVVLAPIAAAVDRLRAEAERRSLAVSALGCGVPGNLDPARERILYNNVAALDGFALAPWLHERFGLPVSLDNDACAAATGEAALVEPGQARRVLFVTVGSGIGVVLLIDGAIVRLVEGVTGDAGHVVVDQGSRERCPVGCHGCLETVASGLAIGRAGRRAAAEGRSALLARALKSRGEVTGADVSAAAEAGDPAARDIIAQAGRWLGVGLASWAPIYRPELVIVGGGVARAGAEWLAAAVATMRELGMPYYVKDVAVRVAALGNQAGVIGAALMALRESERGCGGSSSSW